MEIDTLYVAGYSGVSSLGHNMAKTLEGVYSRQQHFQRSHFLSASQQAIPMALCDREHLPPLIPDAECPNDLRHRRILRMSLAALAQVERFLPEDLAVPIFVSAPENASERPSLSPRLLQHLRVQLQAKSALFDWTQSRLLNEGRPGGLAALELARRYLASSGQSLALVLGADSFQSDALVAQLDREQRIASDGHDGFIAGEGAACLLLTNRPEIALNLNGGAIALYPPGLGREACHYYSEQANRGEVLTGVARQAIANAGESVQIDAVLDTGTGEQFMTQEHSRMLMRLKNSIPKQVVKLSLSRWLGDTGAAAALFAQIMACDHLLRRRQNACYLIHSSADYAARGAQCLRFIDNSQLIAEGDCYGE